MNESEESPSPENIALCAYLIWEQEGRPEGQDNIHWSNAENQLMACNAHEKWCPVS